MKVLKQIVLVLVLIVLFTLAACQGSSFKLDESGIYIKRDGTVEAAVIEPFDQDAYNMDDLRTYVEGIISAYNQEKAGKNLAYTGEGTDSLPVAITSLEMNHGEAKLLEVFENCETYVDFNEAEGAVASLSSGTLGAAMENGIDPGTYQLKDAKSGEDIVLDHLDTSKSIIVLIQGTVNLQVEGKIKAVSEGLNLMNKNTVDINSPDEIVCVIYQ